MGYLQAQFPLILVDGADSASLRCRSDVLYVFAVFTEYYCNFIANNIKLFFQIQQ